MAQRNSDANLVLSASIPTAEVVAQFKYTVLIMPTGVNLVTGLDFAPEQYQSEYSITDSELKVCLILHPAMAKARQSGCIMKPILLLSQFLPHQ